MFDDIMLYIKLVDMGSFSKLAKLLNISQPTISRRIKGLEGEVGMELLVRTTNNIRLTESGQLLYNKFKHHEQYLVNSLSEISQKAQDMYSTLRVALPSAISQEVITPYLSTFLEEYPNINLNISFVCGVVDPLQEGFDIAISTAMPKSLNNVVKLLHSIKVQLYASPTYFTSNPAINSLEEVFHQPIIGYLNENQMVNSLSVKNLDSGLRIATKIKNSRLYVDNFFHVAEIAKAGTMLAAGWDSLFKNYLETGELVKILPNYSFSEIDCYLVRPSNECTPAQLAFGNFLEECFKRVYSSSGSS